jgi:hypothetical protein
MLAPYRPPVLPGIVVLAVAVVGLYDSATTLRQARRAREPRPAITSLAVPVVLPIVWFVLLVVGGVGVLAHQAFGLYLLAAGSAALIASATRSTWTLLLFGRAQSLEWSRRSVKEDASRRLTASCRQGWCMRAAHSRASGRCNAGGRAGQGGPAGSMAAASCPAWRMVKASMIWEKPRNNARKPTQNRIR